MIKLPSVALMSYLSLFVAQTVFAANQPKPAAGGEAASVEAAGRVTAKTVDYAHAGGMVILS